MQDRRIISLGEAPLTLRDVTDLAAGHARLELSAAGRTAVLNARAIVDRLVDNAIPAYGITTGVGSQKDFDVSRAAIERYNLLMITAHATPRPRRGRPRAGRARRHGYPARPLRPAAAPASASNWSNPCSRASRRTICPPSAWAPPSAPPTSSP